MTTLETAPKKSRPAASAEELAAKELVRMAQEQGLSLTGLLKQFTKSVLETALNEEMTEHLGHEKHRAPEERDSTNARNGTRPKTVLTEAAGHVEIDVPRDRNGTFEPQIAEVAATAADRGRRGLLVAVREGPDHWGDLSAHFAEIYRASVSKETISRITDTVIEEMNDWANRPIDSIYAAICIDAIPLRAVGHREGPRRPQTGRSMPRSGCRWPGRKTFSGCGSARVGRGRSSGWRC